MGRPALAALLLCCLASATHQTALRGVNPDVEAAYSKASGSFTCLDKSKTIAFERVNDNYCDCPDGSDEPGSSACPNGSFFCRNRGSEPKSLSSSFVDDGICDCCDGSDEQSGCSNTCLELSKVQRQQLKQRVEEYQKALGLKHGGVQQAAGQRGQMALRLQSIDSDIEAQQAAVERARAEKEAADAAEAARAEERQAQEASADAPGHEEQEPELEQDAPDDSLPGGGGDGEGNGEPAAAAEEEEDEEDKEALGRRIASQWTSDPESGGEAHHDAHDDHAPPEDDEHLLPEDDGPHYGDDHEGDELDGGPSPGLTGADYSSESTRLSEAEERLAELEKEKRALEAAKTQDFGLQDEFLPLRGRCFSTTPTQYTYQVCFFDKALQTETHNEVDIGKWKGFEADYSEALFADGAYCWQGPNRSMRVFLSCGLEEELRDATEPEKCVYTAHLSTPAVCKQSELEALQGQLQQLEQLHADLAEELGITHDEL